MIKILQGDCIEKMRELPDECVHCCVTSPPYYGLRSYLAKDDPLKVYEAGTEQTPEAYVQKMVEVFREVRRVLRSDGVLWLNLGDSYAANRSYQVASTKGGPKHSPAQSEQTSNRVPEGLKSKDLIGVPHRVAFALQADGWYLRAICPWLKRNGMPESTRDRPTQVIEYIFLLTKSQKYFYDSEATKKDGVCPAGTRGGKGSVERFGSTLSGGNHGRMFLGDEIPEKEQRHTEPRINARPPEYKVYDGKRARRSSDWFFESLVQDDDGNPLAFVCNTKPYKGAHFATFPPKLIEPCILAGTSARGCCSKCEAPWERVVERIDKGYDGSKYGERAVDSTGGAITGGTVHSTLGSSGGKLTGGSQTVGWQATCKCKAGIEPCVVLDPFGGSGTTGQVAQQHGRNAVLIELNPAYIPLIEERAA